VLVEGEAGPKTLASLLPAMAFYLGASQVEGHAVLCYAMPCHAVLCCAVLRCAVLCCAMLCYAML
jgi:hypothetical protein